MNYKRVSYIYAIRHNRTKKLYIGCSTYVDRVQKHFADLKRGKHINKSLQSDCDQYGFDFTAYLIEIVPGQDAYNQRIDPHAREAYWIHYYCTDDPRKGYNCDRIYSRIKITQFPVICDCKGLQAMIDEAQK